MFDPRIDVQITLLTFLRVVLVPSVAIASLVASTTCSTWPFTEPYVALAIIAALLTLLVIARDALQQANVVGARGLTLAGRIGLGWLAVVGVLLLLGYATKSSEIFSRRALFLWFLLTPPFLRRGIARRAAMAARAARLVALRAQRRHRRHDEDGARARTHAAPTPRAWAQAALRVHRRACGDRRSTPRPATRSATIAGAEIRRGGCVSDYVDTRHIDVVFIARETHAPGVRELCDELRDTTSSVYLIPDVSLYDLMQARVGDVDGIPVIALCESPLQGRAAR